MIPAALHTSSLTSLPLLARGKVRDNYAVGGDRILVVEGGLREDEFSGGFSLRARRCWDYRQVSAQHAQRLSLRLDLRESGLMQRIDALLAQHRPGPTPLRLDLLLPLGTAGTLDLNGPQSVRVEADLPSGLRALPGVRTVKVGMSKPWL